MPANCPAWSMCSLAARLRAKTTRRRWCRTPVAAGLVHVVQYFETPPLLLISSDMNHFATDEENRRLDEMALKALQSLDPKQLYDVVTSNNISMCGVLPAVIVLETLRRLG